MTRTPHTNTELEHLAQTLDTLANTQRIHTILALETHGEAPIDRATLTADVAERQHPDGPADTHLENIRSALRHTHLPALERAGIINWDHTTDTITTGTHYTDTLHTLKTLLDDTNRVSGRR